MYLDGNSLGMTPRRTIERVEALMRDEWAGGLIGSWDHWIDLPQRVGDTLAGIIGAGPGEVVVHDSVTINLYQLVHAALALRPDRRVIAVAAGEFPTDRYVVDSIARSTGCEVRDGFERLDDVAVAVRSLVDYRSAEVADLAGETARADAAGALLIWDLSHAAGVLDVDLHGAGAQLAVGCTYKYLNGGPGSPGFSYVASDLIERIDQPIWGWFSQVDQFAMGPDYVPRPDVGRLLDRHAGHHRADGREIGHRADRRGRDRGDRRQGAGAHRLRDRPLRGARARLPQPGAMRRGAAGTSRCGIRGPRRSPALSPPTTASSPTSVSPT